MVVWSEGWFCMRVVIDEGLLYGEWDIKTVVSLERFSLAGMVFDERLIYMGREMLGGRTRGYSCLLFQCTVWCHFCPSWKLSFLITHHVLSLVIIFSPHTRYLFVLSAVMMSIFTWHLRLCPFFLTEPVRWFGRIYITNIILLVCVCVCVSMHACMCVCKCVHVLPWQDFAEMKITTGERKELSKVPSF